MKKLLLFLVLLLILTACSDDSNAVDTDANSESAAEEQTEKDNTEEKSEPEEEQEEELDIKVDLEDEFIFENFAVMLDEAEFYEKDGNTYVDLSFDWKNNFGEEAKFIRAGSVFAYQNGEELEETTNAYSDTNSDVHFPNTANGTWGIKLTFQLVDKENPVEVAFVSHETEKEEKITIDIQ